MRLAIVGASARAAAWSALAAGFEVVAADLFADCDLRDRCPATQITNWPTEFESWLVRQSVDAWCYTGGLENHPKLIERMKRSCPLLGCDEIAVAQCRSPAMLNDLLTTPAHQFDAPQPGPSWLVKPIASGGGLGVEEWQEQDLGGKQVYWQQRISGRAISAAFIASGSNVVMLGITEQIIGRGWTGAGRYQYAGSIGLLEVPSRTSEQIERAGQVVAKECDLNGLFGIDFVLDDHGTTWALEVNPRFTASMELIERLTGVNCMAAHVAACTSGELPHATIVPTNKYGGKAYLFAKRDTVAVPLIGDHLADIPTPGSLIAGGDPICTLLTEAREYDSIENRLQKLAASVELQLFSDNF